MTYSNVLGKRFGGPAQFVLSPGAAPGGQYPDHAVTIYTRVNAQNIPCTHTASFFGGHDPGCVAGLAILKPTGLAAPGGAETFTVMTPGGVATPPNVVAAKIGVSPLGTLWPGIAPPAQTKPYAVRRSTYPLPTYKASSQAGPWTTGQIVISQPCAIPPENFTLTGRDDRTIWGDGSISFVSGSLTLRETTGYIANRGWIQLHLTSTPEPSGLVLLLSGALGLGALYWLRTRGATATVRGGSQSPR
jgi:hypothetical protein